MPPVPPMPRVLCGNFGSTPPIGIKQYSSSVMELTLMPRWSILHYQSMLSLVQEASEASPCQTEDLACIEAVLSIVADLQNEEPDFDECLVMRMMHR